MIHKPYCYHAMDDDSAPIDYTTVSSVSEGRRRERQKNIHEAGQGASVRRRAEPEGGALERRTALEPESVRRTVAGKLPAAADGPAPAVRIAYPKASEIPENPFDPPTEEDAPPAGERDKRFAPPSIVAEDGSQFDAPAMAQLPEWYRVAQQNSLPETLRRAPRVQAAPRYDEAEEPARDILGRPVRRSRAGREQPPQTAVQMYEEAGYPPQLLDDQRAAEAERDAVARRRRHGAQYAVRDDRQADYIRSTGGQANAAKMVDPRPPYAPRSPYAPGDQAPASDAPSYGAPSYGAPSYNAPSYDAPAMAQKQRSGRDEPEWTRNAYAPPRASARQPSAPMDGRAANPYVRTLAEQDGYGTEQDDFLSDEAGPRQGLSVPWLGIAAFAVAFLAVGLWLLQLWFDTRAEQAVASRAEAAAVILDSHPYEYRTLIEREAADNNLHPAFVAALIFNESTFRSGAESSVGARGLMQVMSDTAETINKDLNVANYSFDMLYDAEINLRFGCHYLGALSQRFRGDSVLVAAAYHAGPNQVQNWLNNSTLSKDGQSLILENLADGPTKQYAARVKRDFAIYRRLYYENTEEGV